jgi:hypothetical protein
MIDNHINLGSFPAIGINRHVYEINKADGFK